jgi:hypothetical protein
VAICTGESAGPGDRAASSRGAGGGGELDGAWRDLGAARQPAGWRLAYPAHGRGSSHEPAARAGGGEETLSAQQLEIAAELLGPLLDEVVFVGGATVHLWLTEPGAPPARATADVDVICEVASRAEYYRFGEKLRERGLQEAAGVPVLCRWQSAEPDLILDVMPTDADILGFSNPWYEEAISTAATIALNSGAEIRAATPVLLMATKLCAWKARGRGDLLRSLDVHDVLTLVDGRPELIEEIEAAPSAIGAYIKGELIDLRAEPYFDYAVEGATASYGPIGAERARLVRDRIEELLA